MEKKGEIVLSQEDIERKIYVIRGMQVMLDRDLAPLYQVTTGRLNEAVKRHSDRFPDDFMFQLTDDETENWKSQIAITISIKMGLRHNPYAFTEEGVSQLSHLLRSKVAGVLQRFHNRNRGVAFDCYVKARFATTDLQDAFRDYNIQYPGEPTVLHTFEHSHDRWLIIDDTVYHFGASIKDLGKKWFSVDVITELPADDLISKL